MNLEGIGHKSVRRNVGLGGCVCVCVCVFARAPVNASVPVLHYCPRVCLHMCLCLFVQLGWGVGGEEPHLPITPSHLRPGHRGNQAWAPLCRSRSINKVVSLACSTPHAAL